MTESPVVTIDQAMELLHCSRSRVFELLQEGRLVRAPKVGRATVIFRDSVLAIFDFDPASKGPAKRTRTKRPSRSVSQLVAELRAVSINGTVEPSPSLPFKFETSAKKTRPP